MSTAAACFVLSSDRRFEAFVDVGGLTGFAVGCTLLEEVRSLCSPFVEHATLCSCFCGLCTFAGCDLVRSHLSASQRMGLFRDCSRSAFHCLRVVQNEILLSSRSISSNEKVKIVTAVYWQVPEFMLWDLSVICKRKSRNLKRLRLLRWLSVGYRPPVTGCSRKLNE